MVITKGPPVNKWMYNPMKSLPQVKEEEGTWGAVPNTSAEEGANSMRGNLDRLSFSFPYLKGRTGCLKKRCTLIAEDAVDGFTCSTTDKNGPVVAAGRLASSTFPNGVQSTALPGNRFL